MGRKNDMATAAEYGIIGAMVALTVGVVAGSTFQQTFYKAAPLPAATAPVVDDTPSVRLVTIMKTAAAKKYDLAFRMGLKTGSEENPYDIVDKIAPLNFPGRKVIPVPFDEGMGDLSDVNLRLKRMYFRAGYAEGLQQTHPSFGIAFAGCDEHRCTVEVTLPTRTW